jgi:hypothetical protein
MTKTKPAAAMELPKKIEPESTKIPEETTVQVAPEETSKVVERAAVSVKKDTSFDSLSLPLLDGWK